MTLQTQQGTRQGVARRNFLLGVGMSALGIGMSACGVRESQGEEAEYESYVVAENGETTKPENRDAQLAQALEDVKIASDAAELSVAVYNYESQETFLYNPDYESYEASTVKVPIALSVLRKIFEEGRAVDEDTAGLIEASLGFSDNDATMGLFGLLGEDTEAQDAAVNETYSRLEITRTQCADGWGDNLTNTGDQVSIIRAVYAGVEWVGAEDMNLVRSALEATDEDSQGWGVGTLSDVGDSEYQAEKVICKNGWLTDDQGIWHINSTGAFLYDGRTYAVSAMTYGFTQQEDGRQALSSAVEKVVEHLAG